MKLSNCILFFEIIVLVLVISYLQSSESIITAQDIDIINYIGAKTLYSKYTAENVTIAIVDTGLAANIISPDRILVFKDFINYKDRIYDDNGHGSSITSIIGSTNRLLKGIAPNSKFVIIKSLDEKGESNYNILLDTLLWLNEKINTYDIDIINFSTGLLLVNSFSYAERRGIRWGFYPT